MLLSLPVHIKQQGVCFIYSRSLYSLVSKTALVSSTVRNICHFCFTWTRKLQCNTYMGIPRCAPQRLCTRLSARLVRTVWFRRSSPRFLGKQRTTHLPSIRPSKCTLYSWRKRGGYSQCMVLDHTSTPKTASLFSFRFVEVWKHHFLVCRWFSLLLGCMTWCFLIVLHDSPMPSVHDR